MNTKTKSVGRPAANLVYPEGTFTIKQLHALNKRKVRWELSIRQHIDRAIAKKLIFKTRSTVHTGNVGKPAYLFQVSAKGLTKLTVKATGGTPVETPVAVETPAPVAEIPVNEIVSVPAESQPAVVLPQNITPAPEAILDATLAALAPVI